VVVTGNWRRLLLTGGPRNLNALPVIVFLMANRITDFFTLRKAPVMSHFVASLLKMGAHQE